jgi:hypothetical protein
VFGLWSLILGVVGVKVVSGRSTMAATVAVVSWWLLGMAVLAGLAAAFS